MRGAILKAISMTFLISMVPILELRAAIPAGVIGGLSVSTSTIIAIIGNMVPVPFIIVFIRNILTWAKTKNQWLTDFAEGLEKRANAKKDRVLKYEVLGLMILVAIPLPGTGAWTGALVAAMLDMQLKRALSAIFIGVVIAGCIVSFFTYGISSMV